MSMIKVENLTFSYNSSYDKIFDNVTFLIDSDWKLGVVGRNGRGKTTLLNLFLGKYEYKGKIISLVKFDYFPYFVKDKKHITKNIIFEICNDIEEWKLIRELNYLDVNTDVLNRPFETLSNGEQTKVLLAALFLKEEHFLLIDEPTNHLDAIARKKVAQYLKKKNGFILVSHDRNFLDGCVDHILSLNKSTIEIQNGNFSTYLENFKKQKEFELMQNGKLKKEIYRLENAKNRTSKWSNEVENTKNGTRDSGLKVDKGYVSHKATKMMKRSKNIENRQNQAIEEKSLLLKNIENIETLKINTVKYHSNLLVSLNNLSIFYDNKAIFKPISFNIYQGERIFICGKNGSGKSSILKLLLNYPLKYSGKINISKGLKISYVPQDTSFLKGSLKEFAKNNQIDESLFKTILRKLDFERIQFEKNMEEFSLGQKKKVLIAKSLCEKAHLYIWDEPFNYVDIYSRIQIEQLIKEFNPTMLIVEHDEAFKEAFATKIINI